MFLKESALSKRTQKNHIQWKASDVTSDADVNEELSQLKQDIARLNEEELRLDEHMNFVQQSQKALAAIHDNAASAYVTHDDICSLPSFQAQTLIAIKAPSGTTLEVPDPDEGMQWPNRRYQIFLRSSSGPIDVYLVSQTEDLEEEEPVPEEVATPPCDAVDGSCFLRLSPTRMGMDMDADYHSLLESDQGVSDFYAELTSLPDPDQSGASDQ